MPTADRYHHGNLRAALVEAAVDAARARGPEGLALREIARAVGVSHNAAYRHFADRDALVAEVVFEGLVRMMTTLRRRLDEIDEPDDERRARAALYAVGRGYVEFALTEPGLFRVVFTHFPVLGDPRTVEIPAEVDTYALLGEALDALVEVGVLDPSRRPDAEITCWSAVHGFAMLHLDGPLRAVPDADREALLTQLLRTIERSYESPG